MFTFFLLLNVFIYVLNITCRGALAFFVEEKNAGVERFSPVCRTDKLLTVFGKTAISEMVSLLVIKGLTLKTTLD